VVKPALRSRGVQTDSPEEALKGPEQGIEILCNPLLKEFLASMPVSKLEMVQGKEL